MMPDGGQSTCSYNPTSYQEVVDKTQDCTQPAEWHIRIWDAGPEVDGWFSACAEHTPMAFGLDPGNGKRQFHEFGPGCGTADGYWHEAHNVCSTLETALVTGLFWYECTEALPNPVGLAVGVYARYKGEFYRVGGDRVWIGVGPPPGWTPDIKTVTFEAEV